MIAINSIKTTTTTHLFHHDITLNNQTEEQSIAWYTPSSRALCWRKGYLQAQ